MGLNEDVRDVAKLKLLLASCFVTYLLSSRIVVDETPLVVYLLLVVAPELRLAKENLLYWVLRSVSLSAKPLVEVVVDVESCFSVKLFKDSKELLERTPFVLFKTSQLSRRAPDMDVTLMLEA